MCLLYEQFLEIKSFCREQPRAFLAQILPSILYPVPITITAPKLPSRSGSSYKYLQGCELRCAVEGWASSGVVFHGHVLPAGAGACPCVSPHAQPDAAGHAADGGGADPDRAAHRPHPAPAQGRLRPRQGRLREEDPRVSPGTGRVWLCPWFGMLPWETSPCHPGFALFAGTVI